MKKAPVVLVIILVVAAIAILVDFTPKNSNAVAFTDAPVYTKSKDALKYAQFEHMDSNHDGVVTKNEMVAKLVAKHERREDAKTIQEYKASSKESTQEHEMKLAFTQSLNPTDRKLIEGLSFNEAKRAIHLSNNIKAEALRLSTRDKVLYIRNQI